MDNTKVHRRNIKPFDGEKYSVWKLRIRHLLSELDVIKVINEEAPKDINDDWQKKENIAKNTIIEYLSDSFLDFAKDGHSAKQIFENLDKVYERKSIATELAIRKKLLSLKLEGDVPLMKHFRNFEELIEDLSAAGAKITETEKISHLLLTLPKVYEGVITAIETLNSENLTLAFVKTRLLDQETKLKGDKTEISTKVLHVRTTNNFSQEQDQNHKIHFNKHNYYRRNHPKKFPMKCYTCGRQGHLKRDCHYRQKSKNIVKMKKEKKSVNVIESSSFAFMTGHGKIDDALTFILDSGASDHVIKSDMFFSSVEKLQPPQKIFVAKHNTFITATKKGSMQVISNKGIKGTLDNVLYCPEAPCNLLSVRRMQKAGLRTTFKEDDSVEISRNGNIIMRGMTLNSLTCVKFTLENKALSIQNSQVFTKENINDYDLWHQRLGHIGKSKFIELKNKQMVYDLNVINKVIPHDNLCEACINGKQTRLPFERKKDKSHIQRPLFIVHSDICGPITPSTINKKNYFVTFIDDFTYYCVTYLITYKSDLFSVFKDFVAKSEAHFNLKFVNLYCDNGREYLSNDMKNYCIEKGITYHLTVPRTPQQNGVSERMNRTLTEKARSMISGANLEKVFWGEAILTATYLTNITPTKALTVNKTPFELWHNKKPKLKYLKIFGSTVYIHNKVKTAKFDNNSWKGILVGYEPNGYKVWDTENNRFVIVRDVTIDEINYLKTRPIQTSASELESKPVEVDLKTGASELKSKLVEKSNISSCDMKSGEYEVESKPVEIKTGASELNSKPVDIKTGASELKSNVESKPVERPGSVSDKTDEPGSRFESNEFEDNKNKEINENKVRRSDRIKELPAKSYNEFNFDYDYLMIAHAINNTIPNCFDEIKNRYDRHKWEQAIEDELNSLKINKTWILVQKPKDKNIVDCKWVFTIKNDEFGNPCRYKARLVARGFSQQYLVDYNETFAPVARITSLRFIIAFSNQNNLLMHHMDVKTAFLNGTLKEEIFMKVPEGLKCETNLVCKLNKALYGLKQAARCWFEVFEKALIEKGFKNSLVDRCIYILDKGNISENIYVLLYVDDLVIATADCEKLNDFKNYLSNKFSMTDLKEIKFFLGIRIERNLNKISLDQSAYIKTVLEKFNMFDCNAVSTPLPNKLDYLALNSDEKYDAPCRNLIGCLMYITICTRPDLCAAVNILSRYTNKNNKELWQNLKRVLRYLKGTINIKLNYIKTNHVHILKGFVDSDWGGDEIDRKSTTGYLFKIYDDCTISWNTKKQACVAGSSTEAEYMALYEAVKEALWLKSLAVSIHVNISEPIVIFEDNNGCISIANNPSSHKRSKHIDIKYHISRENIEKNIIKLQYIPTGEQIADVLTKPLSAVKFVEFRKQMGLE